MYFIGLVVVLRVVLRDLWLLLVLEVSHQIVEVNLLAPFLAVREPVPIISLRSRVCDREQEVHRHTSSPTGRHRTSGRAEIAAGHRISSRAADLTPDAYSPESSCRVFLCSQRPRASYGIGIVLLLAGGLCGLGDRSGWWARRWGSHSCRTWGRASGCQYR